MFYAFFALLVSGLRISSGEAGRAGRLSWILSPRVGTPLWTTLRRMSEASLGPQRGQAGAPTVLFAIPWEIDSPGGVSQVVQNLLRQARLTKEARPVLLVKDDSVSHAMTTTTSVDVDGDLELIRMPVVAPWNPARPVRHLLTLLVRWPQSLWRSYCLLRRIRPDGVNVHYPGLWCITLFQAYRFACPRGSFVLSFHGADLREFETGSRIVRFWWRLLLRSADAATCCSNSLRARLIAALGEHQERIVAIHNGIDADRLTQEASWGALPNEIVGRRYILNIGTFEHKKGQDLLVRAFASIRDRYPDFFLVIVGRSGPFLKEVRGLVTELGLDDHILLKTDLSHADTMLVLREAEVFVLSSREEPFGIVLLEAAYFDVPIVATSVDGVSEVIIDDTTGLLVRPNDPSELASALLRLMGNPELRRKLVTNAKQRAIHDFTWQEAFRRYRALILQG